MRTLRSTVLTFLFLPALACAVPLGAPGEGPDEANEGTASQRPDLLVAGKGLIGGATNDGPILVHPIVTGTALGMGEGTSGSVAGGSVAGCPCASGGTIGGVNNGIGGTVGGVNNGVGGTVGGVNNGVGGTVGGVNNGIGGTVGGVNNGIGGTVGGVNNGIGGTVGGVNNGIGDRKSVV